MSWKLKAKAQAVLAREEGTVRKDWGGRIRMALVFPNTYYVGMSNLGFQTIYWHLNRRPDIVCERAFFPDEGDLPEHLRTDTPIFSLESQRPLRDFDVVAFSVTYENDYLNILQILQMAGIPVRSAERDGTFPFVTMGGVCAWANPEPLAEFMDFIFVGEGEEMAGEVLELLAEMRAPRASPDSLREEFLGALLAIEGMYVPRFYDIAYHGDGSVAEAIPRDGAPIPVKKRRLARVDDFDTLSHVQTEQTEFGDLALLEVGKGCGRGCRFCMEGEIYRPVRHRHIPAIVRAAEEAAKQGKRVGLVGACVSDYPWIDELVTELRKRNIDISMSSVRADSLTPTLVNSLVESGHRTLTIAPEAGTERLRYVIHKEISDQRLFEAVDLIAGSGVPNVKMYFMIGQPTETDADVAAIADLAKRIRHRILQLRKDPRTLSELSVGVSSFVPKPWTAFQWCAMAEVRALDEKIAFLRRELGRAGIRFTHDVPKWAYLQGVFARGDRRTAELLLLALRHGGDWKRAYRDWHRNPSFYVHRERPLTERFPWDHFEVGTRRERLVKEYQRSREPAPRTFESEPALWYARKRAAGAG